MSFKTRYFTPVKEDKKDGAIFYVVRTVHLFANERPSVEDCYCGFLYERADNPFNEENTESYLIRKLDGVHYSERADRIPSNQFFIDPTEEYEAVGSINIKSLDELITELKSKTENIRQKQMQESRDKGYIVCETGDFEYKQGRR